ncbi:hydratase [Methylobacterium sp. SD21]|uniref:2-keto-4-pentenoate hydratase n=1 Tax=Methylobacterium litchii TaxID=3138810 RepID=UPI00313EFAA4
MSLAQFDASRPIESRAALILEAWDRQLSVQSFTEQDRSFSLDDAYRIADEVRQLREARGERVVGRKIGFTNTTIWTEYNVAAPIWGYVYDTSLHWLSEALTPIALSAFVEPRIEPEIVFRLARAPVPGMDERELLTCVEWAALGFEIVQSHFRGWRFHAPNTVAAFGLHGALFVGEPITVTPGTEDEWFAALRRFEIQLRRHGTVVETGHARNVLHNGPLAALRHLVEGLAMDPKSPAIATGEVVTTGTLTNAYPIGAGEQWHTMVAGLPLADIQISF